MAMVAGNVGSSSLSDQGEVPLLCVSHGVLGIPEPGFNALELAGSHETECLEHAEYRTLPNDGLGQYLQPAQEQGILPVAPDPGSGQLHEVRGAVKVQCGQSVFYGAMSHAMLFVPATGTLMQQRNLLRLLAAQACPKHIGKEAVVAIPLSPVVQRDEEQVGALQGQERAAAIGPVGHGITQ